MAASEKAPLEGWVAIVDDDDSIRRSLARLFRINSINVRTFESAEAFLSYRPDVEPQCLVVDVHLGGMSGFVLQDRLAASGRTPPIIFMTAMDEMPEGQLEGRSGIHTYLRKPFDTKTLLTLVQLLGSAPTKGGNE